nr:MAG TPA: hypothetical protein [Caudoviricetes sp.]
MLCGLLRVASGLSGTALKNELSKKSVRFCTDFLYLLKRRSVLNNRFKLF